MRDDNWNDIHTEDLKRVLDADSADDLNKKDNEFGVLFGSLNYKRGDTTNRFDSEEDVIVAAIKFIREKYDCSFPLQLGQVWDEDSSILSVQEQDEKLQCQKSQV